MLDKNEMLDAINSVRVSNDMRKIKFNSDQIDTDIEECEIENENYILEEVDKNGGYEGKGEEMDLTIKITRKLDSDYGFITFDGYYDSWDGSHYHTITQTKPVEQTIIVYQNIEEKKC